MNEYINLEAEAEHIEGDGGLKDLDNFDEISNLCYGSEEDLEIDDFKNSEVDIKKFEDTLFPKVDKESQKVHNQICYTILYALKFDKKNLQMSVM